MQSENKYFMKFLPMKPILLKLCDDDEVYDRQYYEKKNIINPDIRRQ
jgi:hypothetical protein